MGGILALLSLLDPSAADRLRERAARSRRLLTIVSVGIYVAFLAVALFFLWRAWETTRWFNFWMLAVLSLLVVEVPLISAFRLPRRRAGSATVARADTPSVLRRAVASGDDRLAPLVASQPPALDLAESSASSTDIGPLRRLDHGLEASQRLFAWITPLMAVAVSFAVIFLPLQEDPSFPQLPLFDIPDSVFIVIPGGVAILLLILVYARIFNPGRFRVTADESGLSWREGGASRRIPWADVRAFWTAAYSGSTSTLPRTAYVVDGGDALLIWTLLPVARERARAASDLLCRLIVARAAVPLRDATSLAAALAQAGTNPVRLRALGVPTDALPDLEPPEPSVTRSPRAALLRRAALAVLVPLIPLAAVFGSGYLAQQRQPDYFASLPARLHATTPLYHDPLTSPIGDWQALGAGPDGPIHAEYVDGAYRLSSDESTLTIPAWTARTYGDAAVEVTARQFGAATGEFVEDGVGLIVRADTSRMIGFVVNTAGKWLFLVYHDGHWSTFDEGQAPSAATGDGAANRLLLLMRGDTYLLYINDHLVGTDPDSFIATPRSGRAGVFVFNGATTGAFTDFAVYPVQSPPALAFV
jgi:hypothetical protein